MPRAGSGSRLVVEPLELWLDQPVTLRASTTLLTAPAEQTSPEREQAAALWKTLNATPETAVQEADARAKLDAEMAALRTQAQQDRANALQAQQDLAQAMQERLPATFVYVLGGLLLAALLLIAWLWTRWRDSSEKAVRAWRDSVAAMGGRNSRAYEEALGLTSSPSDTWLPPSDAGAVVQPGQRGDMLPPKTDSGTVPLAPAFVDTAPNASAAAPLQRSPAPAAVGAAAVAPAAPPPHIINTEELFDIQQQADFFVSVGEHQQAIEVLKKHIAERGDVSPLAYLELLRLYHTLSRVEEFSQLRKEFVRFFNANVPEFAGFHRTGRMLYHYTEPLAEIEAAWTSPSVLELLEKFLFRREGADELEPFDLAAYDELLLLLAIAQTTPASARGKPGPRTRTTPLSSPSASASARADAQVIEPLSARAPQAVHSASQPVADSRAAGLDFNFDDFPAADGSAARAPWTSWHGRRARRRPDDPAVGPPQTLHRERQMRRHRRPDSCKGQGIQGRQRDRSRFADDGERA